MKLLIAATLIASTSAMSAGYLQNLASNAAVAGAGIGGYLDALPIATSAPTAGPGMANYLDSVTAPAPVAPAPVAPVAVAPTPVAPAAPAASDAEPAPSAGDYLNHLSGGNSISGAGLRTHVDTLTINSAPTGTGAVFSSYLGLLPANSAGVSGSGLQSYTDMLLSCSAIEGGAAAPVAAGIAAATSVSAGAGNFLESVYNQISTLTAEDVASVGGTLSQSGGSVAFAATSGSTSMTFIKK